jgi:peptidoglycan/LPS O-acetylase OafA/YrhL
MNAESSVNASQNKLLGLEVVRFICALAVLFWHYQHFAYLADKPIEFMKEAQPFYSSFTTFYQYGFYGVQIFWCLSGFIFFWKYRLSLSEKKVGAKKFFILRFSRLYPLHVVTLIFVGLAQYLYFLQNGVFFVCQNNDVWHFVLHLLLASGWGLQAGDSFNGPIWSISLEVLIYLLFYLTLRYLGKSSIVTLMILCGCVTAKYFGLNWAVIDCVLFFYVGGLSATLVKISDDLKIRLIVRSCALMLVFLLPGLIYLLNLYEREFFAFEFSLIYTPILLFATSGSVSINPSLRKFFEALGNMTYSSYLLHFPIQISIVLVFKSLKMAVPWSVEWFFLIYLALTFGASYLTYRFFEIPVQTYLRQHLIAKTKISD